MKTPISTFSSWLGLLALYGCASSTSAQFELRMSTEKKFLAVIVDSVTTNALWFHEPWRTAEQVPLDQVAAVRKRSSGNTEIPGFLGGLVGGVAGFAAGSSGPSGGFEDLPDRIGTILISTIGGCVVGALTGVAAGTLLTGYDVLELRSLPPEQRVIALRTFILRKSD